MRENIRPVLPVLLIIALGVVVASQVYAETISKPIITFYGEHCEICGTYGYCNHQVSYQQAVGALRSYYGKKGLRVLVIRPKERFMEADISRNGVVVDRVLLDLKTGRIRSIY
ncbi:MAG: hypothetical protein M1497_03550 [Nitrospirae bacterium]|nr:hypothetical protein [Nitrospirota bacterium]